MRKRRESQHFHGFDAWGRLGQGLLSPAPFKLFDRSAGVGAAVSQCFAPCF